MAKVSSDKLFRLIKNLTTSEKRHFKLSVSKYEGKGKIYLKLFEAIDNQKSYNEKALLKSETYVKPSQFSNQKSYLYKLILKSLRSEKDTSQQVLGLLEDAKILLNKKMFVECKEILVRAKKIATEHELFWELFGILTFEKNLSGRSELLKITDEELTVLAKIQNQIEYQRLGHEIVNLMNENFQPRTKTEFAKYNKFAQNPLLQDEKNALSYQAETSFYWINSSFANVIGDKENYYNFSRKCVEVIESKPKQIEKNLARYVNALHNFLGTCVNLKRFEEVPQTLAKIRTLPQKFKSLDSHKLQVQTFARTYPIEMIMLLETAQFKNCQKLAQKIEPKLNEFWEEIRKIDQLYFAYLLCYCYYSVGNYSKALDWINRNLNSNQTETREDLYCFSKILNLIIHFELEDYDLLFYIVRSTRDFLNKRHKIYKFEKVLLKFLRKFSDTQDKKKLKLLFLNLRDELLPLTEDSFEQKAFDYFDFISWLESKIQNRPFAEIVREKSEDKKQKSGDRSQESEVG